MGFFKQSVTNVAVVDVHSSSIGAGYVTYREGVAPTLVYSVRIPLEMHATEPLTEALARTLEEALRRLVTEGAPLLRTHSGSGKADMVLTTLAAPWHHSRVSSRVIERERPFVFTKQTLHDAMHAEQSEEPEGFSRANEMVLATLLNGYEVANPYGKRAKRAEFILLTSSLDSSIMQLTEKAIRKALHQHHIVFNSFLPEAYLAMRAVYVQQRDFLVFDIGGEAMDILMAKHGLLVSLASIPHGVNELVRITRSMGVPTAVADGNTNNDLIDASRNASYASKVEEAQALWVAGIRDALADIAKQEPLPHTVFLHAEEHVQGFLRRVLDVPDMRALWLTDQALALVPILPTHLAPVLGTENAEGVDPALGLLALSAGGRL